MKNTVRGVMVLVALTFPSLSARAEEPSVAGTVEANPASVAPLVERGELAKGEVLRAVFTSQIVNREPADELTEIAPGGERVYFFTELADMAGHTVTHRWEYNGQFMGEVKFNVQGSHWRVWSYKTIGAATAGAWTVKILNTVGEVVGEKTLAPHAAQ